MGLGVSRVFEERRRPMRRVLIALALLALLALAPSAFAGGWATVGLSSTPAGTDPGQPWNVNITVLQHGRTPLEGVQPVVTIRNGDATKRFNAKATSKPGVYRASVVFPTAGRWTYEINDGFITGMPHKFPAVEIGAPASAPAAPAAPASTPATAPAATTDEGFPTGWLAIPGVLMLLAAVFLLIRDRRKRRPAQPAPAHHHPQAA
jgi:hypothetical protein